MKTLYLDLVSGISGDMFVGAMLDLGVDFPKLEQEIARLKLEECHLSSTRASRSEISGVKFDVEDGHGHSHEHPHGHEYSHEHSHALAGILFTPHAHPHTHAPHPKRDFASIQQLILQSKLSDWVKEKSIAIFKRIALAEGKIHGLPPEQVHFHEVGAVDSIVDIVGACVALEMLGRPRVLASAVIDGTGWVNCAHGKFPVPAPATLAILAQRNVAVSQCDEPHELITPTGAALLAELVEEFGPMQNLTVERIGFGIGTRENKTRPNVLRAVLGESQAASSHDWETDTVSILETNLDDISPEALGYFMEKALASGALDVFYTPAQMKKNRPGVLLTLLCPVAEADRFSEMILRETTAFGVRRHETQRRKLRREFQTVSTEFGDVTVKLGKLDGQIIQAAPEYESCKKLALEKQVPIKAVYEAALAAWRIRRS